MMKVFLMVATNM